MLEHIGILYLKPGREKTVLAGHPWIFSGAVERLVLNDDSKSGAGFPIVKVAKSNQSKQYEELGYAFYNAKSQIMARMLCNFAFEVDVGVVSWASFFERKLQAALDYRRSLLKLNPGKDCFRLFYSESDGISGLTIDVYQHTAVMQITSAGAEFFLEVFAVWLKKQSWIKAIRIKADDPIRVKEALELYSKCFFQDDSLSKENKEENVFSVAGSHYRVEFESSHKTGLYLDQRDNREIIAQISLEKTILNTFSYTGGFTVECLKAGALKVINVDSSSECLENLEKNLKLNFPDETKIHEKSVQICEDVFQYLRKLSKEKGKNFDIIILDPPKLANSRSQVDKAAKAYKDLCLQAMKMIKSGGHIFVFSCSQAVSSDLLVKIAFSAAADAKKLCFIERFLQQSKDHPVNIFCPESLYLKGLQLRVF